MKQALIFVMILAVCAVYAQGVHKNFWVLNPEGTEDYYIQSTGSDTSDVFENWEIMSVGFWAADTADNDSVSARLIYQISADTSLADYANMTWVTHDTIFAAFTSDSTMVYQEVTYKPMPNARWGRYIIQGMTGNVKLTWSQYKILQLNYMSSRR